VEELAAGQRVEARERFVEKEDWRLLPSGQLIGAGCERDLEIVESASGKPRVEAGPERTRQPHVLVDRQFAVQRRRLGDVPDTPDRPASVPPRVDAVDVEAALRWSLEPDPRLEQR
jgi:hypothetical protein